MSDRYILDDDGSPVPCDSLTGWAMWFEANGDKRRVAFDRIGDIEISTVFLGFDHSFGGASPLLFETMIFHGDHDEYCERYTFREDALKGHARAVKLVQQEHHHE